MTTMTESVRLRVEFKDRHILSKSQRAEGLRRSCVLLQPHHRTISDLAAYLLRAFDLNDSCPDGLLISMDGFVLPSFESTSVFKDKDIVSVKRKGGRLSESAMLDDGANDFEVEEIVERQPLNTGIKLLANEEFEKETGGYESESEEDEPDQLESTVLVKDAPDTDTSRRSKKRKISEKLQSPKRKRSKTSVTQESSGFPQEVQNDVQLEKNGSSHQPHALLRKVRLKKEKSFATGEAELDKSSTLKTDKTTNIISKSMPNGKRSCQLQENEIKDVVSCATPDGTKKLPSRSARRKKAKRLWLREKLKAEKEQLRQSQPLTTEKHKSSRKDNQKGAQEHQQPETDNDEEDEQSNSDSDKETEEEKSGTDSDEEEEQKKTDKDEDIVPIVIRPGYIRFEPLGKGDADQPIQQNGTPVENIQWNGITNKKKGQKWGMERTSHSRTSDYKNPNQELPEIMDVEKEITVNDLVDFNKLDLFTTVPKEGDQIAYRLIELSSCWTPEVSSYRVGKVSWYNPQSNKVMLLPVPEYPIVLEQTDEASDGQLDMSLYGEDGSLEVDYSSLLDVRIVKHGNLNTEKAVTGAQNGASDLRLNHACKTHAATQENGKAKAVNGAIDAASDIKLKKDRVTHAATQENGKANTWDEINKALNAKKAELSQEDGWGQNDGSERSSWSYRGLRGSVLGPTVARLRAQSGL